MSSKPTAASSSTDRKQSVFNTRDNNGASSAHNPTPSESGSTIPLPGAPSDSQERDKQYKVEFAELKAKLKASEEKIAKLRATDEGLAATRAEIAVLLCVCEAQLHAIRDRMAEKIVEVMASDPEFAHLFGSS